MIFVSHIPPLFVVLFRCRAVVSKAVVGEELLSAKSCCRRGTIVGEELGDGVTITRLSAGNGLRV
jgi:hypothetical protein